MKITKRQLRKIIREALSTEVPDIRPRRKSSWQVRKEKELASKKQASKEVSMYDQGREDSFAGIRPQLPDAEYMQGYNEAQADAGLPKMQAPSDSGRGKKLDPSKLKGALAGKYYGRRMAEEDKVPMLRVGDLDGKDKEDKGMYGQSMKKKKKK